MKVDISNLDKSNILRHAEKEGIPHLDDKMSKPDIIFWIRVYEENQRLKNKVDTKLDEIEKQISIKSASGDPWQSENEISKINEANEELKNEDVEIPEPPHPDEE